MPNPTAAQALYPHLANPRPASSQQPRTASALASAMYPGLSSAPKKSPAPKRAALTNTRTTQATKYGAGMTQQNMALPIKPAG
jgi:hypothetical protein